MKRNQKLTKIIQGRELSKLETAGVVSTLTFSDGSSMQIKVTSPPESKHGIIASVSQEGNSLQLNFEGGDANSFSLKEPTSSVLLRDKNGTLEYAD